MDHFLQPLNFSLEVLRWSRFGRKREDGQIPPPKRVLRFVFILKPQRSATIKESAPKTTRIEWLKTHRAGACKIGSAGSRDPATGTSANVAALSSDSLPSTFPGFFLSPLGLRGVGQWGVWNLNHLRLHLPRRLLALNFKARFVQPFRSAWVSHGQISHNVDRLMDDFPTLAQQSKFMSLVRGVARWRRES